MAIKYTASLAINYKIRQYIILQLMFCRKSRHGDYATNIHNNVIRIAVIMIIVRNGEERERTEVLHEAYPTNLRIFRPSFMFVQPFGLHLDVVRRKAAARLDSQTLFPCFAFLSGSSLKFVATEKRDRS